MHEYPFHFPHYILLPKTPKTPWELGEWQPAQATILWSREYRTCSGQFLCECAAERMSAIWERERTAPSSDLRRVALGSERKSTRLRGEEAALEEEEEGGRAWLGGHVGGGVSLLDGLDVAEGKKSTKVRNSSEVRETYCVNLGEFEEAARALHHQHQRQLLGTGCELFQLRLRGQASQQHLH